MKITINADEINKIKESIWTIMLTNGYTDTHANVLLKLFDYMIENQLMGGCHALSSALYVAFSELGLDVQLHLGECKNASRPPFDHSWITLNGKIIDLAIYMPLDNTFVAYPIVCGIETITMLNPNIQYGINTGLPFSLDTQMVINLPFNEYMSAFPKGNNGLWTVVHKILPSTFNVSNKKLMRKYNGTKRKIWR